MATYYLNPDTLIGKTINPTDMYKQLGTSMITFGTATPNKVAAAVTKNNEATKKVVKTVNTLKKTPIKPPIVKNSVLKTVANKSTRYKPSTSAATQLSGNFIDPSDMDVFSLEKPIKIDTLKKEDPIISRKDFKNTFVLPGYHNASFEVITPVSRVSFEFLVSPSASTETRSNNIQSLKTAGGYFIYRLGPGLTQLSISGYVLDTKDMSERSKFLKSFYKEYIVDTKSGLDKYFNNNMVILHMEGWSYTGHVVNLNLSKSSNNQFLYQYSLQMLVTDEKHTYNSNQAVLTNYTFAQPVGPTNYASMTKAQKEALQKKTAAGAKKTSPQGKGSITISKSVKKTVVNPALKRNAKKKTKK